jgi:cytochrome P450
MVLLLIISSIVIGLAAYTALHTIQHYLEARKLGFPILITPFNLLMTFTQNGLGPTFLWLSANVPYPFCHLFDFIHYSLMGSWNFTARYNTRNLPFDLYAPAFVIVTPSHNQVIVSDPEAVEGILSRAKYDFIKSRSIYEPLELFGANVDTHNGDEWARHRRITVPPFNERNSKIVWKESLRQASDLLEIWVAKGAEGATDTSSATIALALHVLTGAGFGQKFDFAGYAKPKVPAGHEMNYLDSLRTVLDNIFWTILTVELGMKLPPYLITKRMKKIKAAVIDFKKHLEEMVEEARTTVDNRTEEQDNLMSAMLRASQREGRDALSEVEISGNLFVYSFAGHDTTATTLLYTIMLLAAYPQWQDWIGEELDEVFAGKDNVEDWEYEEAYPLLKRCQALQV